MFLDCKINNNKISITSDVVYNKICHNIRNGIKLTPEQLECVFLCNNRQKNEIILLYDKMVARLSSVISEL
jgi:hypothetical protein